MRLMTLLSSHRRHAAALCLLVGILAPWAGGCGGSYGDEICDRKRACEGASNDAVASCIKIIEDNEKISTEKGCAEAFSEYHACRVDRSQCINTKYQEGNGCTTEKQKYSNCLKSANCDFGIFSLSDQIICH